MFRFVVVLLFFFGGVATSQEFYYGFYQQEILLGYLRTQLSTSWKNGKEIVELRRTIYTRSDGDKEEQIHATLTPQGELREVSQRVRRKGEEYGWSATVQENQILILFQNAGISKTWNLTYTGKLYFSFQSYLWCNPHTLKPRTEIVLQTLQIGSSEPLLYLGNTRVKLDSGNSAETVKFKSQNEGQRQWIEGFLDRDGNMIESVSYFGENSPLFQLRKVDRSIVEQFGPSGIRIPMDFSIYGNFEELEIEGPKLPFQASPYLEILPAEDAEHQRLKIKPVRGPYRNETRSKPLQWSESLFRSKIKTVMQASFPAMGESEIHEKRTELLLRLCKESEITVRKQEGFRLEGKEWIYYPWIEVDRGEGWEPYFFEENRFGSEAYHFYPGIPTSKWSDFLGKQWRVRRVLKKNEEIRREEFLQETPSFHQRLWGLKFKKPVEIDYVPSLADQILLADKFGSYLLITACPFNPEFVDFSWFDLYVQRLLNAYPEKQLLNRSVNQVAPHRKMIELHFKAKESEPLSIRVFMTSRKARQGLLFVLICKEKYLENVNLWFEPWLTSVLFE